MFKSSSFGLFAERLNILLVTLGVAACFNIFRTSIGPARSS
jgi:uncharacterized membrane protein